MFMQAMFMFIYQLLLFFVISMQALAATSLCFPRSVMIYSFLIYRTEPIFIRINLQYNLQ